MRRVTVTWHPDAVRQAVDNAAVVISAGDPDDVYEFFGGRLSWMDLSALVDASRAALGDGQAVDWEQVALKLALTDGVAFYRLTTPEADALRQLVDTENARQKNDGGEEL